MKQLIAALLLLAISVQCFSKAFVVFDYYRNSSQYAKNCVNKARPQMHCNGKCQMMKKLEQEANKESRNDERKPDTNTELINSFTATVLLIKPCMLSNKLLFWQHDDDGIQQFSRDCFHPPCG